MDVTYTHCAGLDVHKKTVVACCLTPGPDGQLRSETRTFGTMTQDLLALSDWLTSLGITHVAMEATAELWKPVYNLLEANFVVLVVNAQHIKTVPGRKTDCKDAAWIADLLRHGLLRGSFIPPLPQRDLRDLTRQRTNLIQQRAMVVNHLHKVLEWANLKLGAVASNLAGVSARAMLTALVGGEADPTILAELAQGRLRQKRAALEQALAGFVRDHHRFLIAGHLSQLEFLDEQVALFDRQIAHLIAVDGAAQRRSGYGSAERHRGAAGVGAGGRAAGHHPRRWSRAGRSVGRGDRDRHGTLSECGASGKLGTGRAGQQRERRQATLWPHGTGQQLVTQQPGASGARSGAGQRHVFRPGVPAARRTTGEQKGDHGSGASAADRRVLHLTAPRALPRPRRVGDG